MEMEQKFSRRNVVKFAVNDRVSVERSHFDSGGSTTSTFSQLIPEQVTKLLGTIHRVYPNTRKAHIRWDCDGRFAEAYYDSLTLEDADTPRQVFDFIIESVEVTSESAEVSEVAVVSQKCSEIDTSSSSSEEEEDNKCRNVRSRVQRLTSTPLRPSFVPSDLEIDSEPDDLETTCAMNKLHTKIAQKQQKRKRKTKRNIVKIPVPPRKKKSLEKIVPAAPDTSDDSETTDEDEAIDAEEEAAMLEDEKMWPKEVKKRIYELRHGWRKGSKTVDERAILSANGEVRKFEARLKMDAPDIKSLLDFFLLFSPVKYDTEVVLPLLNERGGDAYGADWNDVDFGTYLRYLGLRFYMEVVRLPSLRWYWEKTSNSIFPAHNLGRYMSRKQFEQITSCITLSNNEDDEQQVLDYIKILNKTFQGAIIPSSTIVLDESMIKAYHRHMPGLKKIPRKPRPIGVELKILADGSTFIILNIEKHGSKESMQSIEGAAYSEEFGATVGCSLRLTKPYWETGRLVLGDAWFGSVKCVEQLRLRGLFAIMVVKNNHKNFPQSCLNMIVRKKNQVVGEELPDDVNDIITGNFTARPLARGEWCSFLLPSAKGVLLAIRLKDLRDKNLICSAGTSNAGEPRKTLSGKSVSRPAASVEYAKSSAAIDIYNHIRTGSVGLEDSWQTISCKLRQFAALIGCIEANAFLAYKHFNPQGEGMLHRDFRKKLAAELINNPFLHNNLSLRSDEVSNTSVVLVIQPVQHRIVVFPGQKQQKKCFYCSHAYAERIVKKTRYYCSVCGVDYPLCANPLLSGRNCFELHRENGLPQKKYRR